MSRPGSLPGSWLHRRPGRPIPSRAGAPPGGWEPYPPGTPPPTQPHGGGSPGTRQPGNTNPGKSQPGTSQPGNSQPGAARPGIAQPGVTRPGTAQPGDTDDGTCPRVGQRPLPDPAAVRLLAVPDSAPPYDDALTGLPPGDLALRTGGATWADDRGEPGRAARPGADQAAAAASEPTGGQVCPSRVAPGPVQRPAR